MKTYRRAMVSLAAVLALATLPARAGDFHLGYSGLDWVPFGEQLKGTLRIELRNVGGAEARDVQVDIAHPGADAIEPGTLRFGVIPAGEARMTVTGFIFSTRSDAPLVWRIRYELDGARKELMLMGEGQGGLQP